MPLIFRVHRKSRRLVKNDGVVVFTQVGEGQVLLHPTLPKKRCRRGPDLMQCGDDALMRGG